MTREQAQVTLQALRRFIQNLEREVEKRQGVCCGALYAQIADKQKMYDELYAKVYSNSN